MTKAKVGNLEDKIREIFPRWMRKYLTGVVQGVSDKKRLLLMIQDWCEKYVTLNQLVVEIVESRPATEEAEVPMISVIPDETIYLKKRYYHVVYVLPKFNNEDSFDRKKGHIYREADPYEE